MMNIHLGIRQAIYTAFSFILMVVMITLKRSYYVRVGYFIRFICVINNVHSLVLIFLFLAQKIMYIVLLMLVAILLALNHTPFCLFQCLPFLSGCLGHPNLGYMCHPQTSMLVKWWICQGDL